MQIVGCFQSILWTLMVVLVKDTNIFFSICLYLKNTGYLSTNSMQYQDVISPVWGRVSGSSSSFSSAERRDKKQQECHCFWFFSVATGPTCQTNPHTLVSMSAGVVYYLICDASCRWRCTLAHRPGIPWPQALSGGWTWAGCPECSLSRSWPCLLPAPWWRPWGCIRKAVSAECQERKMVEKYFF